MPRQYEWKAKRRNYKLEIRNPVKTTALTHPLRVGSAFLQSAHVRAAGVAKVGQNPVQNGALPSKKRPEDKADLTKNNRVTKEPQFIDPLGRKNDFAFQSN